MNSMNNRLTLDEDISVNIFTVSAAVVGVCLTVIGLIQVVISIKKIETIVDDVLAFDAMLFMFSSLFAYWALRTKGHQRMPTVERMADAIFISAMLLMSFVCIYVVCVVAV